MKSPLFLCAFLLLLATGLSASAAPSSWGMRTVHDRKAPFLLNEAEMSALAAQPQPPTPTIRHYDSQMIDHFSFGAAPLSSSAAPYYYTQRYLTYDRYWRQDELGRWGPMIFYTGNEGDIVNFWNNTGFAFELAQEFGALVVFGEHRYYGQSMPFGEHSFARGNVSYLTSEQALADYAQLIAFVKTEVYPNAARVPVVALGGSYGGMLAAYFRIKYPNVVIGSLAASAPILQFPGLVDPYLYNKIITDDFAESDGCAQGISRAFHEMVSLAEQGEQGMQTLSEKFLLCEPLKSKAELPLLLEYAYNAISYMSMVDYPYPNSFLQPLPAWPVKVACQYMTPDTQDVVRALALVVGVYYNSTGDQSCATVVEPISPSLGTRAWDYQACTEMVMPISANGKTDMFLPVAFDLKTRSDECRATWGVTPRPQWVPTYYGGGNISAASNIVFSNGRLDPWSGGGMLKTLNPTMPHVYMENSAHHLDLRFSNPADPLSVKEGRRLERKHVALWINEYWTFFEH